MDAIYSTPDEVMLTAGVEAIYGGVDYLTCTLPAGCPNLEQWALTCVHVIKQIAEDGYEVEAFTRNGYRGLGAGGSFCGTRDDGAYLQLAGHYAGDLLDSIARDDLHISRLDLQATVKYRTYAPGVGAAVYKSAVDANGAINPARRRRIWYMAGNDGGYTCYIGSPTSEQRAKLYNKAVQSEKVEYERCWRWEVTGKNDYATAWYRQVVAERDQRPMLCARMVASWFSLRGAPPSWAAFTPLITLPLIKEVPSDAEKKIRWLREQVRPAVLWLTARGFERAVLDALDLGADPISGLLPGADRGGI